MSHETIIATMEYAQILYSFALTIGNKNVKFSIQKGATIEAIIQYIVTTYLSSGGATDQKKYGLFLESGIYLSPNMVCDESWLEAYGKTTLELLGKIGPKITVEVNYRDVMAGETHDIFKKKGYTHRIISRNEDVHGVHGRIDFKLNEGDSVNVLFQPLIEREENPFKFHLVTANGETIGYGGKYKESYGTKFKCETGGVGDIGGTAETALPTKVSILFNIEGEKGSAQNKTLLEGLIDQANAISYFGTVLTNPQRVSILTAVRKARADILNPLEIWSTEDKITLEEIYDAVIGKLQKVGGLRAYYRRDYTNPAPVYTPVVEFQGIFDMKKTSLFLSALASTPKIELYGIRKVPGGKPFLDPLTLLSNAANPSQADQLKTLDRSIAVNEAVQDEASKGEKELEDLQDSLDKQIAALRAQKVKAGQDPAKIQANQVLEDQATNLEKIKAAVDEERRRFAEIKDTSRQSKGLFTTEKSAIKLNGNKQMFDVSKYTELFLVLQDESKAAQTIKDKFQYAAGRFDEPQEPNEARQEASEAPWDEECTVGGTTVEESSQGNEERVFDFDE